MFRATVGGCGPLSLHRVHCHWFVCVSHPVWFKDATPFIVQCPAGRGELAFALLNDRESSIVQTTPSISGVRRRGFSSEAVARPKLKLVSYYKMGGL
ncbi:uncharacterized protein ARMOST_04084 [Armillaria ostoyae]|uniref:Uncharacterized protein n=1 Tax=Armillaria ostoyae TaxID=47428 RepID=A0A284QWC2_ARMOS|nr:uncharacterized protein ARMOST_04084 [Armillaria ostoyae]